MIQRELQKHQWKAFKRNPMFERNLGVRIFMFAIFGILGIELLGLGLFLDKVLLEIGTYTLAIDVFNSFLLYIFILDFIIKYIFKRSQSMQIAPYLTLPIKKNRLFDFLLVKEFSNVWNLYLLFLVVPFALKAITPFFGFWSAILYITFIYLLGIGNSLLVGIANNLIKRSDWYFFLPIVVLAAIVALGFLPNISYGDYTVQIGEWVVNKNIFVWIILIPIFAGLWIMNRMQMRSEIYRELEGEKTSKASSFSNISFLDRFGEVGDFINLDIKMILRSKRLKSQMYAMIFFLFYYVLMLYMSHGVFQNSFSMLLFFTMFVIGTLGLIMGQYMFTSESSFFDGLMARNHSLLNMMKGKYILYASYALLITFLLMILVYLQKLDLLFVISAFFYVIGLVFFLMFQNAVYNKSYFDLFDGGMFNWKGTSSNMLVVTLVGMFVPMIAVQIINLIFSQTVACYFMLIVGLIFTLTANYWIEWTYRRFLKRKYKNMDGFRSNA